MPSNPVDEARNRPNSYRRVGEFMYPDGPPIRMVDWAHLGGERYHFPEAIEQVIREQERSRYEGLLREIIEASEEWVIEDAPPIRLARAIGRADAALPRAHQPRRRARTMATNPDSIVEALRAVAEGDFEWAVDEAADWAALLIPAIESLVAENARLRGLVNQIHPLAEGLAVRCEILESVRDRRLSLVTTEDLAKHAGDTSASIYAALDRILADTNALKGDD